MNYLNNTYKISVNLLNDKNLKCTDFKNKKLIKAFFKHTRTQKLRKAGTTNSLII
jgi:hypothetical protein